MKSVLDWVHRPRELSINDFRYRLLHWVFNQKNIKCKEDSDLPHWIYEKYCPLVWISVFLICSLWIIIPVRMVIFLVGRFLDLIKYLIDLIPERQCRERVLTPDQIQSKEERAFPRRVVEYLQCFGKGTIQDYIREDSYWYEELDLLSMEERFNQIVDKWETCRIIAEERKQKRAERMVFLVRVSEVVVRGLFYVAALGIILLSVWLLWNFTVPVLSCIASIIQWFLNFDYMTLVPFLVFLIKLAIGLGIICGIIFLFRRYSVVQDNALRIGRGLDACLPPLVLVKDCLLAPFKWIVSAVSFVTEVVHVIYTDNCPNIVLVEDEDVEINSIVEETL